MIRNELKQQIGEREFCRRISQRQASKEASQVKGAIVDRGAKKGWSLVVNPVHGELYRCRVDWTRIPGKGALQIVLYIVESTMAYPAKNGLFTIPS